MLILKGHAGRVHSLAFSPDGRTLASAGGQAWSLWLWDVPRREARFKLRGHRSRVTSLAFSPDGRTVASADAKASVKLWDAATGQERATLQRPQYWHTGIFGLAFSPDGKTLAAGDINLRPLLGYGLRRWDIASLKEHSFLFARQSDRQSGGMICLAYSPDGRTLAAGSKDRTVKIWDLPAGRERTALELPTEPPGPSRGGEVRSVAFSPDGGTLAVAAGTQAYLRDWRTGGGHRVLPGHTRRINRVAFSPDGLLVATASNDRSVKLWDAATGRERIGFVWPVGEVHSLAFSPDGMTAAAGGQADILLWDLE